MIWRIAYISSKGSGWQPQKKEGSPLLWRSSMPQNYSNFLSYNSDAISTTNLKSSLDIVAESWWRRTRCAVWTTRMLPANQTQNLPHIHQKHQQKIPSIKYRDIYIGFTALSFCQWEMTIVKAQAETPYSEEGRQHYFKRTKKKRMNARLDEMYSESTTRAVCYSKWGRLNNFEFVMNRAYSLNRDRLKCRICGGWLISVTPCTHRVDPNLPLNKVNRVNNLVSMHRKCLDAVNNPKATPRKWPFE